MIELVKRLINEVNQECFNNELIINFPIEICNTARTAAYISHTRKTIFHPTMKVTKFAVSKNYQWTEEQLRNTVAHELIHVYITQKLNIKDCHGPYFKAKMAEINKNPKYHVTVRHNMKTTKEQNPRAKRSKLVYFIANREKTKITFLNKHPERLALKDSLINHYGNDYQVGTISSDKITNFRVSRKLRYSYKVDPQKLALIGI